MRHTPAACTLLGLLSYGVFVGAQTPALPILPIVGIAHVSFQVSDLAKARAFYGGVLGLQEISSARDATVAVYRVTDRQRIIVRAGLPPDRDERLLALAFEASDVAAVAARLAERGVKVLLAGAVGPVYRKDTAGPEGPAYRMSDTAAGESGIPGTWVETRDPDDHPLSFVQLGPAGAAPPHSPRAISRRILHAGLTVRDQAVADRFYADALGFSEIWRGGRDNRIDWINMKVPRGTDYLEYMLVTGPVSRQQLGSLHHVALLVPDIQAALETVRARVSGDDRNARATPSVGRNNRWQLNLFDPDGTRVELMEPFTMR